MRKLSAFIMATALAGVFEFANANTDNSVKDSGVVRITAAQNDTIPKKKKNKKRDTAPNPTPVPSPNPPNPNPNPPIPSPNPNPNPTPTPNPSPNPNNPPTNPPVNPNPNPTSPPATPAPTPPTTTPPKVVADFGIHLKKAGHAGFFNNTLILPNRIIQNTQSAYCVSFP